MIVKSIKELAWDVDEPTYRSSKAISYSALSTFARDGVSCLSKLDEKKDAEALRFGSLVDTIMTEPEELENKFVIAAFNKPSDAITNIVTKIWNASDKSNSNLIKIPETTILMYIKADNYQSNWLEKTRINKIVTDGSDYFKLLATSEGKVLMSQDDYNRALACVEALNNSPFVGKYFYVSPLTTHIEAHYQLKFIFEYNNIFIRCMFDRIIVDHKNKTIQPLDIKTTGKSEEDFHKSFLDWRYDLQATMYSFILRKICDLDDYFKDFEILPFTFICVNRFNLKPLAWQYNDSLVPGDRVAKDGTLYEGWYTLYLKYMWHLKNNKLEYSFESYADNGVRKLNNLSLKNE